MDNVLHRRLHARGRAQLVDLHAYIAAEASLEVAAHFTDGVITYCESLSTFHARGTRRDGIPPGLRITSYRKRVAIAFHVDEDGAISSEFSMAIRTMKQAPARRRMRQRGSQLRGASTTPRPCMQRF